MVGKVMDAEDEPLAGIIVRATTGTRVPFLFAQTDDEGVFRFTPLPAGEYSLTPVRSYHDTQTGDSLEATLPYPLPSIRFQLSSNGHSAEPQAVIKASPMVTISVEVFDGDGKPKSDGRLSIGDAGDFVNAVLSEPVVGSPGKQVFRFPRDRYIRDLKYRRSMEDAAFYQIDPNHPPVAAEAVVLGKAQEDMPTIRVIIREAATLIVNARTENGEEPTGRLNLDAGYGEKTRDRIKAAEKANRKAGTHFMEPRLFHTHPAGKPWAPTFRHLVPGEPIVVEVNSTDYVAEPKTVVLEDGEERTIELILKTKEREQE